MPVAVCCNLTTRGQSAVIHLVHRIVAIQAREAPASSPTGATGDVLRQRAGTGVPWQPISESRRRTPPAGKRHETASSGWRFAIMTLPPHPQAAVGTDGLCRTEHFTVLPASSGLALIFCRRRNTRSKAACHSTRLQPSYRHDGRRRMMSHAPTANAPMSRQTNNQSCDQPCFRVVLLSLLGFLDGQRECRGLAAAENS